MKILYKLFRKNSISFLNEKWEVVKPNVSVKHIPRTHEVVFLSEFDKYYRVCNVVYNFEDKGQGIFVIIEEYVDDDAFRKK